MKNVTIYLLIVFYLNTTICYSQQIPKEKTTTQKGILIYYMSEPYFFPITDTSLEKISKSNVIGLKLGRIDLNDIFEKISHKSNIVTYVDGKNNKIDTVKNMVGVLLVKMVTKPIKTKLSSDTAAFNFEYHSNTWAIFKYEIRFDTEVVSIEPVISSDMKALKQSLKAAQ